MENIISYMEKSKDKTYKQMPFNELDALVYALLPYIDFSGISMNEITIKEAYKRLNQKFFLKKKDKFTEKNRNVLKLAALSQRYCDNIITNYTKINTSSTQFCALTIVVPHHFKYIAFEGTDDNLVGWEENFKMSYTYPVEAQSLAAKYFHDNTNFKDLTLFVGGHSKGGNLAVAAVMENNFFKRFQVDYIFNFDGPGFLSNIENSCKYRRITSKIRNYYPEDSFIGMILKQKGKEKYLKSKSHLAYQHDAHNWQIIDNHFVLGEKSKYSLSFQKRIDNLFKEYDLEKRQIFVTSFFTLLFAAGYTKKSELTKVSMSKIKNILKNNAELDSEKRSLIINVFKTIINNPENDETQEKYRK